MTGSLYEANAATVKATVPTSWAVGRQPGPQVRLLREQLGVTVPEARYVSDPLESKTEATV